MSEHYRDGHGCTFVPPEDSLPDAFIAELRRLMAGRDDIHAVYWTTAIYVRDGGTFPQNELHIELADPPQESADEEQYDVLQPLVPRQPLPRGGLVWCISPPRLLDDVREVGLRIM